MEPKWLVLLTSIKSAYKSWAVIFGILLSAITAYKLYVHLMDIGLSKFIKPIIDFYNEYIGGFFNKFLNFLLEPLGLELSFIYSDWLLLYTTICTILFRPFMYHQIKILIYILKYIKNIDRTNTLQTLSGLIVGLWFFILNSFSLLIRFFAAPAIAIKLFFTPHITQIKVSFLPPKFLFEKNANLADQGSSILSEYVGDYRLMVLSQFVGFIVAFLSFVTLNILAKEYID